VGSQVVRKGKTYYKDDSGNLHANYRAAVMHSLPEAQLGRAIGSAYSALGGNATVQRGLEATGNQLWQSMGVTPPASAAPAPAPSKARPRVDLNAGMSGKNWPDGVPGPGARPDPATWQVAPGLGRPAPHVAPAERARDSNLTAMAQQYAPNYWQQSQNEAALLAARGAGDAAAAARGQGPLAELADSSNPRSQAYWDRADIQQWAKANDGLARRLRTKHGLPEDPTAAIPIAMPAVDAMAVTAEDRGLAEAGYQGQVINPGERAGLAPVSAGEFTPEARFTSPTYGVMEGSDPAAEQLMTAAGERRVAEGGYGAGAIAASLTGATPLPRTGFVGGGLPAGQSFVASGNAQSPEFTEPFLPPNEMRALNLGGNDALQVAHSSQQQSTGVALKPASAEGSEIAANPAKASEPASAANPADELARRYLNGITRTARLGY
jgi:hypothetical protein